MSEKETKIFNDPGLRPDDEAVFSNAGKHKELWKEIINYMSSVYPGSTGGWNYYNDGKQWLYKMVYKKKTVYWASMMEGGFHITFYFGDKAEPAIMESGLSNSTKESFLTGKRFGKIRAISYRVDQMQDYSDIFKTIDIRVKQK